MTPKGAWPRSRVLLLKQWDRYPCFLFFLISITVAVESKELIPWNRELKLFLQFFLLSLSTAEITETVICWRIISSAVLDHVVQCPSERHNCVHSLAKCHYCTVYRQTDGDVLCKYCLAAVLRLSRLIIAISDSSRTYLCKCISIRSELYFLPLPSVIQWHVFSGIATPLPTFPLPTPTYDSSK